MPRAIPEPLRAKGRCPLEPWIRWLGGIWRIPERVRPAVSIELNLMLDRYGLEFSGFRYFVVPQEEHLYPVVTVSSHAALTCTCSS